MLQRALTCHAMHSNNDVAHPFCHHLLIIIIIGRYAAAHEPDAINSYFPGNEVRPGDTWLDSNIQ